MVAGDTTDSLTATLITTPTPPPHPPQETRAEREALSRRIDSRDEHIRRLAEKEGRYGVPGRARRVSGASDTAGLADNENVLEMEASGIRDVT